LPDPNVVASLRAAGCVFAEEEAELIAAAATSSGHLDDLLRRRVAGEPLETILGWAEFCGLRVVVLPGVFVPRARTGLIVRRASASQPSVVLDLCCGSGAVAAVLQRDLPNAEVHCADIDPVAVECARRNVNPARVHEADLFDGIPAALKGRVDVITMSPPYVPTEHLATMPIEAREHEPRRALDGGVDGLEIARHALAEAGPWLAPHGRFLFETSRGQSRAAAAAAAAAGWVATVCTDDELEGTTVECRLPC
jgi:release factor glutamine methyltransferase